MGTEMSELFVDASVLREQVRQKYREVASDPGGEHHFHTGRGLAARLDYSVDVVESLPEEAVESFAGVGNPFVLRGGARRVQRAGIRGVRLPVPGVLPITMLIPMRASAS